MKMLTVLVAMAALAIATAACQVDDSRVADGINRIETKLADIEDRQIELAAKQDEFDAAIKRVSQRIDRDDEGLGELLGLLLMMSWMVPAYSEVYGYVDDDKLNPEDLYQFMEEMTIEDFVDGDVIEREDIHVSEPQPAPDN